jgi:hypothetical protein
MSDIAKSATVFVSHRRAEEPVSLEAIKARIASTIATHRPGQAVTGVITRRSYVINARRSGPIKLVLFGSGVDPEPGTNAADDLIEQALQQSSEAHLTALRDSGLPISSLRLLQSWLDMNVQARLFQQQIEFEQVLQELQSPQEPELTLQASGAASRPDPMALLSAVELGRALDGVSDETVRLRARQGELFSVLKTGRKRGSGYPAFQAWPGIAGTTLTSVLAELGYPASVDGAGAHGFFASVTDLLGDLSPVEVLTGAPSAARPLGRAGRTLLASSPQERLKAVVAAAQAYAAQVHA